MKNTWREILQCNFFFICILFNHTIISGQPVSEKHQPGSCQVTAILFLSFLEKPLESSIALLNKEIIFIQVIGIIL